MLNTEVCQKILAICQTPAPDHIAASISWYLVARTLQQGQSHTSLLWIKCTWLTFFKGGRRCSTTHLSSDLSLGMTFSMSPKSPFLYPDSATFLLLRLCWVDWEDAKVGDSTLPMSSPSACGGYTQYHQGGGLQWLGLHMDFALGRRNWDNSGIDSTARNHCMDLCNVRTPGEGQHYSHVLLCRRQGCRRWVIDFKHCFRRMKSLSCLMFWMCLFVAEERTLWVNLLAWEEGSVNFIQLKTIFHHCITAPELPHPICRSLFLRSFLDLIYDQKLQAQRLRVISEFPIISWMSGTSPLSSSCSRDQSSRQANNRSFLNFSRECLSSTCCKDIN